MLLSCVNAFLIVCFIEDYPFNTTTGSDHPECGGRGEADSFQPHKFPPAPGERRAVLRFQGDFPIEYPSESVNAHLSTKGGPCQICTEALKRVFLQGCVYRLR